MAYDNSNIFAKILRGELPAHRVCEDADTLAFLDIMPQLRGPHPGHPQDARAQPPGCEPPSSSPPCLRTTPEGGARGAEGLRRPAALTLQQFSEPSGGQGCVPPAFSRAAPLGDGKALLAPRTGKMEKPEALATSAEKIRQGSGQGVGGSAAMATLLVIGASRGIGLETVKEAPWPQGHRVRAFARGAAAIPLAGQGLAKIASDALDASAVAGAVAGCDAVVQALGDEPAARRPCCLAPRYSPRRRASSSTPCAHPRYAGS